MAQNINPTLDNRENELLGLVNWSLPWLRAVVALMFLIGLQQIGSFLYSEMEGKIPLHKVWQLASGLMVFLGGVQLLLVFFQKKKYVLTENEIFLGRALAHLGTFWVTSLLVCFFSALTVMVKFGGESEHFLSQLGLLPWGWVVLPISLLCFALLLGYLELKLPFSLEPFSRHIPSFARANLARTRWVFVISLLLGLFFVGIYIIDSLFNLSTVTVSMLFWGISLVGLGTGIGIYWRAVREIHRNPSIIYFERTMERLNLFWLIAVVCLSLQFIGNLFPS